MTMSQKFQADVRQGDGVTLVKLAGVIDEDNELNEATEKVAAGQVIINLADIERINSCGVRDWVNWLGKIEKNGAKAVLVECSPAIVAQINLVNNFTGQGAVKSFFAPYFCPQCDREKVLLVDAADLAGKQPLKAPTCRCDECDGVMDFDDMEDSYFAFLSNAKKIAPDVKLDTLLSKLNPTDGAEKRIRTRGSGSGVGGPAGASGTGPGQSLPSVPSLPGVTRTERSSVTGSRPGAPQGQLATRPVTATGAPRSSVAPLGDPPAISTQSSKMLYVIVALIVIAIALLAVVVFHQRKAAALNDPAVRPAMTAGVHHDLPLRSA
jgi:anti-anti-sigma factor